MLNYPLQMDSEVLKSNYTALENMDALREENKLLLESMQQLKKDKSELAKRVQELTTLHQDDMRRIDEYERRDEFFDELDEMCKRRRKI